MTDQELMEKVRAIRDHLYEAAMLAHQLSAPLPGAKFKIPEPGVRLKQLISEARGELEKEHLWTLESLKIEEANQAHTQARADEQHAGSIERANAEKARHF